MSMTIKSDLKPVCPAIPVIVRKCVFMLKQLFLYLPVDFK